jgi:hypothetical protein
MKAPKLLRHTRIYILVFLYTQYVGESFMTTQTILNILTGLHILVPLITNK